MLQRNAAEGIHRIEDAYVNWFLVEEAGRLTVVDTGHPASWKSLHQALRELGRTTADIDAVVLTHAHFDHMGFAQRAQSELGVTVWAHEKELPVTHYPWRYDHERSPRVDPGRGRGRRTRSLRRTVVGRRGLRGLRRRARLTHRRRGSTSFS